MTISPKEIISTRIINAPREKVYRAFANPQHLKNWWGPAGFTNTFYEFDFRAGGKWKFTMHAPDGANYENESEFVEIVENEKIVFNSIRFTFEALVCLHQIPTYLPAYLEHA